MNPSQKIAIPEKNLNNPDDYPPPPNSPFPKNISATKYS